MLLSKITKFNACIGLHVVETAAYLLAVWSHTYTHMHPLSHTHKYSRIHTLEHTSTYTRTIKFAYAHTRTHTQVFRRWLRKSFVDDRTSARDQFSLLSTTTHRSPRHDREAENELGEQST
jgi:hypothetical protein